MSDAAALWYEKHAAEVTAYYEALNSAELHGWLNGLLPKASGLIIDVSAGSGRDAAWFAGLGHEVLAIEPSTALRDEGARLHPDVRIRWLPDSLPSLAVTLRLGLTADVILLSGVWQHVAPADCVSAWKRDPVSGVIGVQSGPP